MKTSHEKLTHSITNALVRSTLRDFVSNEDVGGHTKQPSISSANNGLIVSAMLQNLSQDGHREDN